MRALATLGMIAGVASASCRPDVTEVRAESLAPREATARSAPTASIAPPEPETPPVGAKLPTAPTSAPGALVIAPPIPRLEEGMMDHAYAFGWSRDGSVLGYCAVSGGSGATVCETLSPGGRRQRFDDAGPADGPDPAKHAALALRVKALGLGARGATWPFAHDLELTWTQVPGDAMHEPPVPGLLRVGARVRGEPAAWSASLAWTEGGGYHETIHPETIALSPNGKHVGVIAHAFGGEFSDAMMLAILPVSEVAARAYETAAAAHRIPGDDARAKELAAKAAAARSGG